MNILLDENLRKLRLSHGNRQEDLAAHLGVSAQSVSKWERGENLPDLTLIPAIASYYNVTVDDLLGVGEVRKQEKINRYFAESQKLLQGGRTEENIALMRKAVKEFPNEYKLISNLAFALFFGNNGDKTRCSEAIKLDERILKESTDINLRGRSIHRLCYTYHDLGNNEKAKEYAEMGDYLYCSREVMLSAALVGEEGDRHNKALIAAVLELTLNTIDKLDGIDRLTRHEFRIKLLELFFDDGFMGSFAYYIARYHYSCAVIYAGKGDDDKVRYHLESAVKYSKQFESLNGEYTYHSKILSGHKNTTERYITNRPTPLTEEILNNLTVNDSEVFAPYSSTDWFKALLADLKVSENKTD